MKDEKTDQLTVEVEGVELRRALAWVNAAVRDGRNLSRAFPRVALFSFEGDGLDVVGVDAHGVRMHTYRVPLSREMPRRMEYIVPDWVAGFFAEFLPRQARENRPVSLCVGDTLAIEMEGPGNGLLSAQRGRGVFPRWDYVVAEERRLDLEGRVVTASVLLRELTAALAQVCKGEPRRQVPVRFLRDGQELHIEGFGEKTEVIRPDYWAGDGDLSDEFGPWYDAAALLASVRAVKGWGAEAMVLFRTGAEMPGLSCLRVEHGSLTLYVSNYCP